MTTFTIVIFVANHSNESLSVTQEVNAAELLPASHWKKVFDSSSMDLNSGDGQRCFNKSQFPTTAENLYHFGVCTDGLTSMYLATKDPKYIDRAFLYLNNLISNAKTDSRGYKGWDTNSDSLDTSHGWRSTTRFLHVIKNTPELYNNTNFRSQYNSVLAFTEKHVFENYYNDSLSRESRDSSGALKNSLIYRGRTHMASHWAYMAMYLRRLSQDNSAISRYNEVIKKYDRELSPYYQSSLRNQIIPNKNVPTAIFFSDRWERFDGIGSDMHHAQDTIGYIIEAYELGESEWTELDIFKLRETLKKVIWKGTANGEWQSFAGFMDGSNGTPETIIDGKPVDTNILGRCQEDGFLKLGRYDSKIQEIMQNHSPRGCMTISVYGNLAQNIHMLTSRGHDLRSYTEQEVKNSYDTISVLQSIQAESFNDAKGIEKKSTYISSFDTGDWIKYDNINLNNAKQFRWRVNGRNAQNYFQVRLDNPTGPVISYLHTQPQDDSSTTNILMRELVSPITSPVSGYRTIYLTAAPSLYGVANIDSFQVESRTAAVKPTNPTPTPITSLKPTPSLVSSSPNTSIQPSPSAQTAQERVIIRARGTPAKNSQGVLEYPLMRLVINGQTTKEYTVSDSYHDYEFLSSKITQIQVHYINDPEKDSDADRNLQIDYIRINDTTYESEAASTYSVGSWSSTGCTGGYKQSEWLHCVGYFEYDIKPSKISEVIQAESYIETGGKVVVQGQELRPGVLSRDGYIYRFDPGDYITYRLKNPINTYTNVTLYLKSRNTGGTIEILSGDSLGKVIGSKVGFRPAGLTLPDWQSHNITLAPGSDNNNNVTLRSVDMYEIAYIDRMVFSNSLE